MNTIKRTRLGVKVPQRTRIACFYDLKNTFHLLLLFLLLLMLNAQRNWKTEIIFHFFTLQHNLPSSLVPV